MRVIDEFDVVVIGAGHAGVEAAFAAARLGKKTAIFTLSLDQVANLPCNPSIGGSAKGQIVSEIDALGGEMGRAADHNTIQSRTLNLGKGPAVHSLRTQIDRSAYHAYMKALLETTENLHLKQAEVAEVLFEDKRVVGIKTVLNSVYHCKAVIIATGTYLKGKIHIGDFSYESGPDNVRPSTLLTESLRNAGLTIRRFKTGTPARVNRRSIDYSQLEEQPGDDVITPFSFGFEDEIENKVKCHITYTNLNTHNVILSNLHRSPLYGGVIEGVGPRYCPSIEDKVVRFSDKERHQIFLEPMGLDTDEIYIQGMSSSLPEDVQIDFYKTIKGLEKLEIMRPAYAIEYDCCDPLELLPTLEFIEIKGLYGAGQFNGTSGYEEAGAQGLVAGINASRQIDGLEPIVLDRGTSYIGVLIDDLTTKGCNDPYRMMTSRSEYRLYLRQDNATDRLIKTGYDVGLVSDEKYARWQERLAIRQKEIKRLKSQVLAPSAALNDLLTSKGTSAITTGYTFANLLKRPQMTYQDLVPFDENSPNLPYDIIKSVEIEIKYEGYLNIQLEQIESMRKTEAKALPVDFDYNAITGLRLEAKEKLNKIKPLNIGQAARISGVNPADVSVLLVYFSGRSDGK